MQSKEDIYNGMLFEIGHTKRVNNANESSIEAQNCGAVYDRHRRTILSMGRWKFAKVEKTLTQTGNTPPTGFAYEYNYPNDCITALSISKPAKTDPKIPFTVGSIYAPGETGGTEKRVIWTNEPNAKLWMIRNVENTALFSPSFAQALIARGASDLAVVMAKSQKTSSQKMGEFQFWLNQAINIGEIEAEDEPEQDAPWILDR